MANTHSIEAKVYEWFQNRFPEGPQWTSPDFKCFIDAPLELRILIMMDTVEGEIATGGLPQLLWNVFFHWRRVLEDCETGYEMTGAIPQRNAVREYRALFEHHEDECRSYIERCIQEDRFEYFNEWCSYGREVMESPTERLFHTDSGVYEQRLRWLADNEDRLAEIMAA